MSNNLWWAYDSEEKSFSTLPAGPFLIPALLISGAAVLWRSCFNRRHTIETIAGELVNNGYWRQKRIRYDELVQRQVDTNNNLELNEMYELKQLSRYLRNPYGH